MWLVCWISQKPRERRLLRSARLPPDRNHKNGRSGADRYPAQELVVADVVSIASILQSASWTPEVVNKETGAYLHRLQWSPGDRDIGALPRMELARGMVQTRSVRCPKAVHFTREALGSNSGRRSTTVICGLQNTPR